MITKVLNGKKVRLYDSIEELPMANFQKFNRYLLLDSGIGCDFEDIDQHIEKIGKLMHVNKAAALQELQNMRQNMYYIVENINTKFLAFIALIHDIDGKVVYDLSDKSIKELSVKLNTVEKSLIYSILEHLKKNLNNELILCFPTFFDDTYEKEIYTQLRHKTFIILDAIINEQEVVGEVEVDSIYKPKVYSGKSSVEIAYMKQYETASVIVAEKTGREPGKLSVFEFYSILESIKKYHDKIKTK